MNHGGVSSETRRTVSTNSPHLNQQLRDRYGFEAPIQIRSGSEPERINKDCWLVGDPKDRDIGSPFTSFGGEAARCDLSTSADFAPDIDNKLGEGESQYRSSSHVDFLLGIFKPIPAGLTVEDVSYLHQQGAFLLPPRFLRIKLFRCYVESVHCKMPFLDLDEVREIVMDGENILEPRRGLVALLLFQAVVYAGSAFIDSDYVRTVGFENRDSAQSVYFNRVKVNIVPHYPVLPL